MSQNTDEKPPTGPEVKPVPQVGGQAPTSSKLPFPNGKPTLVVFLRHCGCPFAEKVFKTLATMSEKHPSVRCIAVSHSSAEHTERWIPEVGGTWNVEVVIDEERQIYADWGLGNSSIWHFANPRVLYSVYKLGTGEGIWNRPADTGTRYQTAGAFGVDRLGNVVWGHVSSEADDLPNFDEAIRSLDA